MSTIIAEAGKQKFVDLPVQVLDPEDETVEETCISSDADSTVEVLEKSIDEVKMDESLLPTRSKAVEDKREISKDGADRAWRKRKSDGEEGLLEGVEVMSIKEVRCPSSAKKLMEKSGKHSFIMSP